MGSQGRVPPRQPLLQEGKEMITAWVYYYDGNRFKFEQLNSSGSFASTNPKDWGLSEECSINLVLQNASFIQAWIDGEPVVGGWQ
jgi:hypothetical protein